MTLRSEVCVQLGRMKEARRQIQRQLDQLDRQIIRRMMALIHGSSRSGRATGMAKGDHPRVDRIGLRPLPAASGKSPHLRRIQPAGRDARMRHDLQHRRLPAPIFATLVEVEGEDGLQLIWSRPNRD